jgi:hypothetical protein
MSADEEEKCEWVSSAFEIVVARLVNCGSRFEDLCKKHQRPNDEVIRISQRDVFAGEQARHASDANKQP